MFFVGMQDSWFLAESMRNKLACTRIGNEEINRVAFLYFFSVSFAHHVDN